MLIEASPGADDACHAHQCTGRFDQRLSGGQVCFR